MWTRPLHPYERFAFLAGVAAMALIAIDRLVPNAGLIISAFFN